MHGHHPFDKRDALAIALLGVAIGTIVLGVGGVSVQSQSGNLNGGRWFEGE